MSVDTHKPERVLLDSIEINIEIRKTTRNEEIVTCWSIELNDAGLKGVGNFSVCCYI